MPHRPCNNDTLKPAKPSRVGRKYLGRALPTYIGLHVKKSREKTKQLSMT